MALGAFLELIGDTSSPADKTDFEDFITKAKNIVATIERQISFTKDYEDLGVNAPVWKDVGACAGKAMAGLAFGKIHVAIDTGDLEVYADPMLEKVFYNLFDNALRYGGDGLSIISITSGSAGTSRMLVIEDNGIGISPEDKGQLFTKGFGRHTGLGLFLSREILAITGITIAETGTFGAGARFELTIPEGIFRFVKPVP
jgi:signal transduction histidine kinase